jgi:hypothetical protein
MEAPVFHRIRNLWIRRRQRRAAAELARRRGRHPMHHALLTFAGTRLDERERQRIV